DRDFRQIDLLLARKHQQQIERTFEAFDIDDQRGLVARALDDFGLELDDFSAHATAGPVVASPIRDEKRLRASAISKGAGGILSANAASARRAASPARTGEAWATSVISARSPLQ